ncbi:MAG TPA: lysoplasmalogenase [Lacibacter sp.]|nr:lysoplasmalogenase [Lacibacter sp.]HMO89169.1 lysoplasmalogenase [Lacibacter sp.]HMP87899.1 lysoplasmalogenase [Lacibacter sp.]
MQKLRWPLLYWLLAGADILLIWLEQDTARWYTKPLLMPVLALWLYQQRSRLTPGTLRIITTALACSWAGDVLLQVKGFFLPGLVSFLLAHLCYIIYFSRKTSPGKGLLQQEPLIGLPVAVYIGLFLWLLYPFLDTMRLPVTIYAGTIGLMLLLAINQRGKSSPRAATLFFNGALQFVISDSLLAVNLFAFHHQLLSICVMLTYASAQYLIVKGVLHTEAGI